MQSTQKWKEVAHVALDNCADAGVANGTEDEHVEEHVPRVEPEVLSDDGLITPPRDDDLQRPYEKRDPYKPPEETLPRRLADGGPEV
ncbi:MAG: hypothetical protein RIR53_245 [Bacteroidota bacterium]